MGVAGGGLRRGKIVNRSLEFGNAAIEKLKAVIEGAAVSGTQTSVEESLELGAIGVGAVNLVVGEVEGGAGELFRREGGELGKRGEL